MTFFSIDYLSSILWSLTLGSSHFLFKTINVLGKKALAVFLQNKYCLPRYLKYIWSIHHPYFCFARSVICFLHILFFTQSSSLCFVPASLGISRSHTFTYSLMHAGTHTGLKKEEYMPFPCQRTRGKTFQEVSFRVVAVNVSLCTLGMFRSERLETEFSVLMKNTSKIIRVFEKLLTSFRLPTFSCFIYFTPFFNFVLFLFGTFISFPLFLLGC